MGKRLLKTQMVPTIRKRIRGDVENPHHLSAPSEIQRSTSCFPNHPESAGIGGLQRPPRVPSLRLMHPLAIWKILALISGLLVAVCQAAPDDDFNAVDGPNVRVMRHEDGARTYFTRTPDNRTLVKKKFSPNGRLQMLTVYRMDANSNPIGCKIFDGQNKLLFKVSYGYRKTDGQLVEERMFDARLFRKDPKTGKETPVQIVRYVFDAQGNRSAPIVYNLLPGKTFEEVFGVKSSALETNPFHEGAPEGNGNPNARPPHR